MARKSPRLSLLETTAPEDIIYTNEEIGSVPFFIIDDEYGISGCYADYALVTKKVANNTGKVENGENPAKVYSRFRWDELKYCSDIAGIFECYYKIKELEGFKKLKKSTNIDDLTKIRNEIKADIHKALDVARFDNNIVEVCSLIDTVQYLKKQIAEAKPVLDNYKKLLDETEKVFKEGKKIIVENMPKHKKHKETQEDLNEESSTI